MNHQRVNPLKPDKMTWLAHKIFTVFPQECTGLRFYSLDCGCIYYQKVFIGGELDPQIGIYRDADYGPCESCSNFLREWKDSVIGEVVV